MTFLTTKRAAHVRMDDVDSSTAMAHGRRCGNLKSIEKMITSMLKMPQFGRYDNFLSPGTKMD